jgi:uncharacterized protein (TIGR02452 family)
MDELSKNSSVSDDKSTGDFDHITWLKQFEWASANKEGFRELRAKIFQDTIKFVNAGSYRVGDKLVSICNENVIENAEYFDAPDKLPETERCKTNFSVINADCLETSHLLLKSGFNPCVLNLASRQNPGGGVLGGAGAQEENLFRRTNLFLSLYQLRLMQENTAYENTHKVTL